MAFSNLNNSESKYLHISETGAAPNSSKMKQTISFPIYNSKQQNDDQKAKNWVNIFYYKTQNLIQ